MRTSCSLWLPCFVPLALLAPTGAAAALPGELDVLHEPLPAASVAAPTEAAPAATSSEELPSLRWPASELDGEQLLPEVLLQDGLGLHPPAGGPQPSDEELPYLTRGAAQGRAGTTRSPSARLDRSTGRDGLLTYHEVFNPSVAPFKRDASYDLVREDESLGVAVATPLEELPLAGTRGAGDAEMFWGSLVVELAGDEPAPIPSVAPQVEIIAYRTTPTVDLAFLQDSAGNLWVRPRQPHRGPVRLVFLSAAPATSFGGPIPDFSLARIPARLRPVVPASIRQRAEIVLRRAGIAPGSRPRDALYLLVDYFRNFRSGEPPPSSGPGSSTYLELSLAQRGVCRHRSLAFVITAQSVGIPARYVHNEAHAFVEVFLPGQGWRRIDLGGDSAGLQVRNGLGCVPHQPRLADPFPRPEDSARSDEAVSDETGPDAPGTTADAAAAGSAAVDDAPAGPGTARSAAAPAPAAWSSAERDRALPWRVVLERATPRSFRGEEIEVAGRVEGADGQPVPGAPVALQLWPRRGRKPLLLLGMLASDAAGRFAGKLQLPAEIEPGGYAIEAVDGRRALGE